jgi:hypothetical protein
VSYMRGACYIWRDDERVHVWADEGMTAGTTAVGRTASSFSRRRLQKYQDCRWGKSRIETLPCPTMVPLKSVSPNHSATVNAPLS